mmetsp:Transcript_15476/g.32296  ORF Transcript_15476/g.32296 Transcript_15476/m.32296 type:complete len:82 (+) Transcript_15476:1814-2059(+)
MKTIPCAKTLGLWLNQILIFLVRTNNKALTNGIRLLPFRSSSTRKINSHFISTQIIRRLWTEGNAKIKTEDTAKERGGVTR